MSPTEIEAKLKEAIGQWVRLVNVADVDFIENHTRIHVIGKLYGPDEEGKEYSIAINETVSGMSVIGFYPCNVTEVFRQPSGTIEITVR